MILNYPRFFGQIRDIKFVFCGGTYYLYGEKGLQGGTLGQPFRF